MRSEVIEYNCDICGQHGNGPHFRGTKALCKFHFDLLNDKDKAKGQRENEKEFKKVMARFEKRR